MDGLIRQMRRLVVSNERALSGVQSKNSIRDNIQPDKKHIVLEKKFVDKFDEVFVIGDVHGCFDELEQLLKLLHLQTGENYEILKIYVGDLVNKGPKSAEVLDLVRRDWTKNSLGVRGNHEEIVLENYYRFKLECNQKQKPDSWIHKLNKEQVEFLRQLPYTIDLPSLDSLIVHAGLIPIDNDDKTRPANIEDAIEQTPLDMMIRMRNLILKDENTGCVDGVDRDKNMGKKYTATKSHVDGIGAWGSFWKGPRHVYFGHDARRVLQMHPMATGLDTGALYGKELTGIFIKGPRKGQLISVKSKKVYVKPESND